MIQKDLGWCQIFIGGDRNDLSREATIEMNQVHSTTIQAVSMPMRGSRIFPQTDGLITDQRNILLVTKTADCVPILLWNEKAVPTGRQEKVIAVLHCGWKGFFRGIIEAFGKKCQTLGYSADHFSAFLGPHLRKESFEVREDFFDHIPEGKKKYLLKLGSKYHYDLTLGVMEILNSFGIQNVEDCGIDTMTSQEYFSYRAMGKDCSRFTSCIIMP